MAQLPTIYALGNNNKILEWTIEIQGNKHRVISGARNDKKVASEWTVCEAKNVGRSNETTPEQQALLEAQSKWEKKLKSGGYWRNISDITKIKFVEPMLAHHYPDKISKIKFPVMVDRKYNGMRCIIYKCGMFTRKGEKIVSAPHIWESVQHLFYENPNLVLDGELYNHEYRYKLNEIIRLVRKTKNISKEDLIASAQKVDYYVYDAYGFNIENIIISENTNCSSRRMALTKLLANIPDIVAVSFKWALSHDEVNKIYQEYVDDGYEGAIIRLDGAYEHKRSNNLLKFKPEDDDEGVVIDISDGKGNWSGAAYNVTIKWQDKIFDAVFKGSYEKREEILKNKKNWIGKKVKFTYMGFTGFGIPNSARIDPDNCSPEK